MPANPLTVDIGDSAKLLKRPLHLVIIPMPEIVSRLPLFSSTIEEHLEGLPLTDIYLNQLSVKPSIYGTDYNWYLDHDTTMDDPYSIEDVVYLLQKQDPISVVGVTSRGRVAINNLSMASMRPSYLAIALEATRDVLQRYYLRERPWMHPAIRNRNTVYVDWDTATNIEEMFLFSSIGRGEEIASYPSNLIKVDIKPTLGVVISVLCDVRIYQYTYEKEMLC